jgi:hypothetical protein
MRDQMNQVHPLSAIAPQVVTDNTAKVSAIINRKDYESLTFLLLYGTLSDADTTLAVTMRHGDDSGLSDGAAVAATDLVGTLALAGAQFDDDGECRKIGYIGSKQYVELTVTPSNNTGNIPIAAIALLGNPRSAPTPNPPL